MHAFPLHAISVVKRRRHGAARGGSQVDAVATVVTVSPNAFNLGVNGTQQLTATVRDQFGDVMAGAPVAWSSGTPSVATVDSSGLVTGVGAGSATITATSGAASGTAGAVVTAGTVWHASASGLSSNTGSAASPWDLVTAAAGGPSGEVQPGDVVELDGTAIYFDGNTTQFNVTVSGSPGAPVTFRAAPGARVQIDGYPTVSGSDVDFWELEFFSSDTNRVSQQTLSFPTDLPRANYQITVNGARVRWIHCIAHDLGNGFVPNESNVDGVVYGCLSFNHGWDAPDRGHGHGVYAQSTTAGRKILRHNIIFNQFDYGMQLFSQSTHSDNVTWDENIAFTNGSLSAVGAGDFTLGTTENPMQGLEFTGNCTYQPGGALVGDIGRNDGPDAVAGIVTGNSFGGDVRFKFWQGITVTGNEFFGGEPQTVALFLNTDTTFGENDWDHNTYWQDQGLGDAPQSFGTVDPTNGGQEFQFSDWKTQTGYDASSTFTATAPNVQRIKVFPSDFIPGRAHVAVYNWNLAATANIDLSSVLSPGDGFEVRHACDFYGTPVLTGTYAGGSVSVPLAATVTPVQPIGGSTNPAPSTAPLFYAFVVLRTSQGSGESALIELSATEIDFSATAGGSSPAAQTVNVTNSGTGSITSLTAPITYGPSEPTGWLATSFDQTTAPAVLTLTPTLGVLAVGVYHATVAVTSADASNSPVDVSVVFTVTDPGNNDVLLAALGGTGAVPLFVDARVAPTLSGSVITAADDYRGRIQSGGDFVPDGAPTYANSRYVFAAGQDMHNDTGIRLDQPGSLIWIGKVPTVASGGFFGLHGAGPDIEIGYNATAGTIGVWHTESFNAGAVGPGDLVAIVVTWDGTTGITVQVLNEAAFGHTAGTAFVGPDPVPITIGAYASGQGDAASETSAVIAVTHILTSSELSAVANYATAAHGAVLKS